MVRTCGFLSKKARSKSSCVSKLTMDNASDTLSGSTSTVVGSYGSNVAVDDGSSIRSPYPLTAEKPPSLSRIGFRSKKFRKGQRLASVSGKDECLEEDDQSARKFRISHWFKSLRDTPSSTLYESTASLEVPIVSQQSHGTGALNQDPDVLCVPKQRSSKKSQKDTTKSRRSMSCMRRLLSSCTRQRQRDYSDKASTERQIEILSAELKSLNTVTSSAKPTVTGIPPSADNSTLGQRPDQYIFPGDQPVEILSTPRVSRDSFKVSEVNFNQSVEDFIFQYQLGKGGFGEVYAVRQRRDGRPLAIKIVSKRKVIDAHLHYCLRVERNILVHITENKCKWLSGLQSCFQDSLNIYFVMPLFVGGTLMNALDYLTTNDKLDETVVLAYTMQMILATEEIHNQGVIHRDIKPENFLVNGVGDLLLTDFGMSFTCRSFYNTPQAGCEQAEKIKSRCGTPGFESPEIVYKQPYDGRTDYWSLGMVIYEMVYGKNPVYDYAVGLSTKKKGASGVVACAKERDNIILARTRKLLAGAIHDKPIIPISPLLESFMWSLLCPIRIRLGSDVYEETITAASTSVYNNVFDGGVHKKYKGNGAASSLVVKDDARTIKRHGWFKGMKWDRQEQDYLPGQGPSFQPFVGYKAAYQPANVGPIVEDHSFVSFGGNKYRPSCTTVATTTTNSNISRHQHHIEAKYFEGFEWVTPTYGRD